MNDQYPQAMDITSLKAVISELRIKLIPSKFELAFQPDSSTIQLGFRNLDGIVWIEISWSSYASRIVEITPPLKKNDKRTLAKQIQNILNQMALTEISQKGFERVVEFGFSNKPGEKISKTIYAEVMGKHSNLILIDEKKRVITLGKRIKNNQSRKRPIGTGDIYIEPPSLIGIEPDANSSFEEWKRNLIFVTTTLKTALINTYQGISPSLAMQLISDDKKTSDSLSMLSVSDISNHIWANIFKRWLIWLESIDSNKYSLDKNSSTDYKVWGASNIKGENTSISLYLGKYYRERLEQKNISDLNKEIIRKIINLKNNELKSIKSQTNYLNESENFQDIQDEAHSILSKPKPSKMLIEEAQKLYKKAKKLRRSIPLIKERIKHHEQRVEIIDGTEIFFREIKNNDSEEPLVKIELLNELISEIDELFDCIKPIKRKNKKINSTNHLEIISPNGLKIQIGRNHNQNEIISIRKGKNGDIWFHAQECPGSHVVLKSSSMLPCSEDIQLAADLAAYFSKAKGNKKVAVIMVPIEKLRKIPGSLPGVVRHNESKVLWAIPSRGIKYKDLKNY